MYLWHCTADGQYSLYEVTDQNYLRGMQISDASGKVNFSSIFPGCYSGRWPHCHFEIFDSLEVANSGANARKTSQLALPQHECELAYADSSYGNSLENLGRLSLTTDGIFSDGWSDQLGTVTGSRTEGFTVNLLVRV
jgi:protocatechuate 3,4-dioxygenase beta subunit